MPRQYPLPQIGEKFNRWEVISEPWLEDFGYKRYTVVRCRCECGTEQVLKINPLISGRSKSCGCWNREAASQRMLEANAAKQTVKVGDVYNGIEVLEGPFLVQYDQCRNSMVRARCHCGKEFEVLAYNLRKGSTKSCGCEKIRITKERSTTHGSTQTVLYRRWASMIQRCTNPTSSKNAHRYVGRGIRVCGGWLHSFENFKEWAMKNDYSPQLSIDRIDNDKHYSCGVCAECLDEGWAMNCRWVDRITQARNRSNNHFLTFDDKTMTVEEWANFLGIDSRKLHARLKLGWPLERVLSTTPELHKPQSAYAIWYAIKYRCFNNKSRAYASYGGAGITMCNWLATNFRNLTTLIGKRPSPDHSVDRIDTKLSYSCGQCEHCKERGWPMNIRWADWATQARNKSTSRLLTFRGETRNLVDWANDVGIPCKTIQGRLDVGWSVEDALTIPVACHLVSDGSEFDGTQDCDFVI